jgi:hypothetical protein
VPAVLTLSLLMASNDQLERPAAAVLAAPRAHNRLALAAQSAQFHGRSNRWLDGANVKYDHASPEMLRTSSR